MVYMYHSFLIHSSADGHLCMLSRVKQTTSPGWMHETSTRTWCTGKTQRDGVGREVGGGIGMGNTCKSMADSFQCMTKPTTIKKKKRKSYGDKYTTGQDHFSLLLSLISFLVREALS